MIYISPPDIQMGVIHCRPKTTPCTRMLSTKFLYYTLIRVTPPGWVWTRQPINFSGIASRMEIMHYQMKRNSWQCATLSWSSVYNNWPLTGEYYVSSVHLSVCLRLWGLRCAPLQFYRATFYDLRLRVHGLVRATQCGSVGMCVCTLFVFVSNQGVFAASLAQRSITALINSLNRQWYKVCIDAQPSRGMTSPMTCPISTWDHQTM